MRGDYPHVIWTNYSYGYEARLRPNGKAFARARMVTDVPGIHYELIWIYGPKYWLPFRVRNIMVIERHVERYVKHHRAYIAVQLPPDPLSGYRDSEERRDSRPKRAMRIPTFDMSKPHMASLLRLTGFLRDQATE